MTITIAAECSFALKNCLPNQYSLLNLGENSPNQFYLFSGHMKYINFPLCLPVQIASLIGPGKAEVQEVKFS